MQPTPQDNQLMSKHRVLSFKPQPRLERRGQDGQNETEQPDHSASLSDSITASTQIRFSVHTARKQGPDVGIAEVIDDYFVPVGIQLPLEAFINNGPTQHDVFELD